MEGIKIPQPEIKPQRVPTTEDLRKLFNALPGTRDKAIFLMLATSGLRVSEVLELCIEDVDMETRTIYPRRGSRTKRTWVAFFNEEAAYWLRKHLEGNGIRDGRIFDVSQRWLERIFEEASQRAGVNVKPSDLRKWFATEMARLGVPDRYVDAFCGRVPRNVLARHYTDFSPERLREIYERAGLRVLQ